MRKMFMGCNWGASFLMGTLSTLPCPCWFSIHFPSSPALLSIIRADLTPCLSRPGHLASCWIQPVWGTWEIRTEGREISFLFSWLLASSPATAVFPPDPCLSWIESTWHPQVNPLPDPWTPRDPLLFPIYIMLAKFKPQSSPLTYTPPGPWEVPSSMWNLQLQRI